VGSNPWTKEALKHNLATICERYAAADTPAWAHQPEPGELDRAREIAAEIVAELKT